MGVEYTKKSGPLTYGRTEEEAALYREIARRLTGEENPVYIYAMMMVFSPDQARVFLAFPPATVVPTEEIAQKTGFSKEFVEDSCQELYEKGYMVKTRRGWAPTRSSIQAGDTGPTQKWADIWGDGFFQLMRAARLGGMGGEQGRWNESTEALMTGIEYPMFKVYPHIKALHMSGFKDEDILDIEDYREDFKKASAVAVNYCCCRRGRWGAKDYPEGYVCVCFDRGAEYQTTRGSAKLLTPEQMLELEENICIPHFDVYTASNMLKQDYVCNCGVEVGGCIWGPTMAIGKLKDGFAPSRYQAVVDPTKCKACGLCVDNCNVHASSLKQYPDGTTKAWVDPEICMGCGCCVVNCPNGARKLILVRPPEFIVRRDSMPSGRYDTPESYLELEKRMEPLKAERKKRDKEMEDKWCAEKGVNRNPYGIKP